MSQTEHYNAAQRLYEILLKMKGQDPKLPTYKVYLNALEIKGNKSDAIMAAYNIAQLADEVKHAIESNSKISDFQINKLKTIFIHCKELNLEAPWVNYIKRLSPEAMTSLESYGLFFEEAFPEKKLPKDEYDKISKEINELFSELSESEIDDDLKKVLLCIIETARRCLSEYKIKGAFSFQHLFELSVGKIIFIIHKKPTESSNKYLTKVKNLIIKCGEIASSLNSAYALGEGVKEAIKKIC